jgi:hypothetical protein
MPMEYSQQLEPNTQENESMPYNCTCGSTEIRLTTSALVVYSLNESGQVLFECDMTDYTPNDFQGRCMDCGATDLLTNSVTLCDLLEVVVSEEVEALVR